MFSPQPRINRARLGPSPLNISSQRHAPITLIHLALVLVFAGATVGLVERGEWLRATCVRVTQRSWRSWCSTPYTLTRRACFAVVRSSPSHSATATRTPRHGNSYEDRGNGVCQCSQLRSCQPPVRNMLPRGTSSTLTCLLRCAFVQVGSHMFKEGINLTKISLPVCLFEPRSFLERLTTNWEVSPWASMRLRLSTRPCRV